MSKPLGETEKTVLVGALILGGWLGIDALVSRASKRSTGTATSNEGTGETEPTSTAMRRVLALRSRRRRRRAA